MLRALAVFTASASVTLPALAQPGRAVDLRPRWTKGSDSALVMKIDSKNTVSSPIGLGESDQHITQEITLREHVLEVDPEKGAVVELTYERVKVKFDANVGAFDFDSDDPEGKNNPKPTRPPNKDGLDFIDDVAKSQMVPYLKKIAGTKLKVTFDGDGKITAVDGGSGLMVPGMMGPVGGLSPTPKGLDALFGPISSVTTGDAGRVKVGDTWTSADQLDLQPMGGLKMVTKHTLKKVTGDLADIAFVGSVEPASVAPSAPFKITSAAYDGTYSWNAKLGRLQGLTARQETSIESSAGMGPDGGGTTMKSQSTMKVERTLAPPAKKSR